MGALHAHVSVDSQQIRFTACRNCSDEAVVSIGAELFKLSGYKSKGLISCVIVYC
jgi:hypothetical protein